MSSYSKAEISEALEFLSSFPRSPEELCDLLRRHDAAGYARGVEEAQAHIAELDERCDGMVAQIEAIHSELACEREWSNLHDLFDCVHDAVRNLVSHYHSSEKSLTAVQHSLAEREAECARLRAALIDAARALDAAAANAAGHTSAFQVDHIAHAVLSAARDEAFDAVNASPDIPPKDPTK